MTCAEDWIEYLHLEPHPEGGYYREIYRATTVIPGDLLTPPIQDTRCSATSVYFLLRSSQISRFHRLKSDELWYFHAGSSLRLHLLTSIGEHFMHIIGINLQVGEIPQLVIPAGSIFAAEVSSPESFSLIGCMVSPGFDFNDFEMPFRVDLLNKFPQHASLIKKFTI
jgi:predicted cupin superfamily sugar epimerase